MDCLINLLLLDTADKTDVVQVTDSDSDKFSDGEYLDDDIEKGNAVMAAVTVVIIFLVFFLCMAIMLTWTLLVLGDHQV